MSVSNTDGNLYQRIIKEYRRRSKSDNKKLSCQQNYEIPRSLATALVIVDLSDNIKFVSQVYNRATYPVGSSMLTLQFIVCCNTWLKRTWHFFVFNII